MLASTLRVVAVGLPYSDVSFKLFRDLPANVAISVGAQSLVSKQCFRSE